MSITAMKQALDALLNYPMTEGKAITALRQAIEQAEKQEPIKAIDDVIDFLYSTGADNEAANKAHLALKQLQMNLRDQTVLHLLYKGDYEDLLAKIEQEPEHWSDCAIYNEPAYLKGECDCGGYYKPIAYKEKNSDSIFYDKNNCSGDYIPLYTAPPKRGWVGLTEADVQSLEYEYLMSGVEFEGENGYWAVYRAIEAKLRERNT